MSTRVVIVEVEPRLRASVRRGLERAGFEVAGEEASAEQAVELVERQRCATNERRRHRCERVGRIEFVTTLETLQALREELTDRAAALRAGADVPSGGISFGKRVGEGTNIAIERFADVAIHDQIIHQLEAVEAALLRVAEGTYGICEVCRRPIAPERLEAIPWAATCVACA